MHQGLHDSVIVSFVPYAEQVGKIYGSGAVVDADIDQDRGADVSGGQNGLQIGTFSVMYSLPFRLSPLMPW